MKLHYDPETASLYVELQSRPSAETREITDDVRLDLHEAAGLWGWISTMRPRYST